MSIYKIVFAVAFLYFSAIILFYFSPLDGNIKENAFNMAFSAKLDYVSHARFKSVASVIDAKGLKIEKVVEDTIWYRRILLFRDFKVFYEYDGKLIFVVTVSEWFFTGNYVSFTSLVSHE